MIWGYLLHHWEDRGALRDGDQAHCHARIVLGAALDLCSTRRHRGYLIQCTGALVAGVIGAFDSVDIVDNIIFTAAMRRVCCLKEAFSKAIFSYYIAASRCMRSSDDGDLRDVPACPLETALCILLALRSALHRSSAI